MLLDTSGLLCLFHREERQHDDARRLFHAAGSKLTHNYVLTKFVALCQARGLPRVPSLRFVAGALENPAIEVLWMDEALHRAAVSFLEARPDKAYSLCDAVSFLVMRERGISESLTTDRHFEQEGFARTLRA